MRTFYRLEEILSCVRIDTERIEGDRSKTANLNKGLMKSQISKTLAIMNLMEIRVDMQDVRVVLYCEFMMANILP